MLTKSLVGLVALPALAAAHFQLVFPTPRGTDDEGEYNYPCAGYEQSQNRTAVSTSSFPLALDLGHDRSLISIFLALGNEAGENFHHQLQPTAQEEGPGDFCFPNVPIPSNLNVTNGQNGTIQVITDAENGKGLYMCADVTFVTEGAATPASCTNGTGLRASFITSNEIANGTTPGSNGTTGTTNGSSTSSMPNAAPTKTAIWGLIGAAAVGAAALV